MVGRRGSIAHYNNLRRDASGSNRESGLSAVRAEFARRLQDAMVHKGWTQSDLARFASRHVPKPSPGQKLGNRGIGRALISRYISGEMLPNPVYLEALARALDVEPGDLIPAVVPGVRNDPAPFELRALPDGRVFIRVAQPVSQKIARKILDLLTEDNNQS
jgi:transcriptional regulator with XRE-family HTH domain